MSDNKNTLDAIKKINDMINTHDIEIPSSVAGEIVKEITDLEDLYPLEKDTGSSQIQIIETHNGTGGYTKITQIQKGGKGSKQIQIGIINNSSKKKESVEEDDDDKFDFYEKIIKPVIEEIEKFDLPDLCFVAFVVIWVVIFISRYFS